MVDAVALEATTARCGGSSPSRSTIYGECTLATISQLKAVVAVKGQGKPNPNVITFAAIYTRIQTVKRTGLHPVLCGFESRRVFHVGEKRKRLSCLALTQVYRVRVSTPLPLRK